MLNMASVANIKLDSNGTKKEFQCKYPFAHDFLATPNTVCVKHFSYNILSTICYLLYVMYYMLIECQDNIPNNIL